MGKKWLNFIPEFITELPCNYRQSSEVDSTVIAERRFSNDLSRKSGVLRPNQRSGLNATSPWSMEVIFSFRKM